MGGRQNPLKHPDESRDPAPRRVHRKAEVAEEDAEDGRNAKCPPHHEFEICNLKLPRRSLSEESNRQTNGDPLDVEQITKSRDYSLILEI